MPVAQKRMFILLMIRSHIGSFVAAVKWIVSPDRENFPSAEKIG